MKIKIKKKDKSRNKKVEVNSDIIESDEIGLGETDDELEVQFVTTEIV